MSEWMPIETAPKDGTPILVWNGDYLSMSFWNKTYKQWPDLTDQGSEENAFDDAPTHWMPLPEPPTD